MANTTRFEIKGVGPVLFERSKRAKRVSISVRPFKGVRVAIPYRLSFNNAMEFVNTKTGWIKIHLEKMRRYEREYVSKPGVAEVINKEKAKKEITRRLKQLAEDNGFSYNRVFIRNQKTRWGSCSSKNNISLNMKLVRLSQDLKHYVILHKLVHTYKKDHSRAF